MTNPIAIVLAILIVAGIVADSVLNNGSNLLFLSKKFVDLTEWLAFWR